MHIRNQLQLANLTALSFCGFLFLGITTQSAFARQADQTPKSNPPANPVKTDQPKDSPAAKPLTKRPDPRKPVLEDKAQPKTDREIAQEKTAREAAKRKGEITFDDIKFDIEKGGEFKPEMITPELKELVDKKMKTLRGFMLPASVFQQKGIKKFVLVRDDRECCFGPGAALFDCVMVEMAPGKSADFSIRMMAVKGKFEIDTESFKDPDGGYQAVYKITADEAK
jgi:hypothetical protein